MAWARKSEQNDPVIAVIGDGALTGGMTFEALNNLKGQGLNILIIFNDNGMGIDPNAGAVHQADPGSLKSWFEFYGIQYDGPVNGHDLDALNSPLRGRVMLLLN
jgi:1-deoxy-D-xylulose-5-phosphate synthase